MSKFGTIDMRSKARLLNLVDPTTTREPALARDVMIFPLGGGKLFSNQTAPNILTTISVAANIARFSILEVKRDCTISQALTEVATAAAGGLYRTALYNINSNLYPTSLVWDGGVDQNATTVGLKGETLGGNKTLKAGVYLNVIKTNAAITMRSIPGGSCSTLLGHINGTGLAVITGFNTPLTWVANTPFPTTFPTLTVTNLTNAAQPIYCYNAI